MHKRNNGLPHYNFEPKVAQRSEPMCGVSENDRVLYQDQWAAWFLLAQWGSPGKVLGNASRSMEEKLGSGRDYTFSDAGRLIKN